MIPRDVEILYEEKRLVLLSSNKFNESSAIGEGERRKEFAEWYVEWRAEWHNYAKYDLRGK